MAKVSKTLVLFACVLVACLVKADARQVLQSRSTCPGEPPEGDWLVDDSIPTNDTLELHFRFVLTLRKINDDMYQGSAGGVAVRDAEALGLPAGQPVTIEIIGFWNPDTCVMTAVLYNLDNLLTDPVHLVYDGDTLSGPYLNVINGTALFDRTAFLSISPIP